MNKTKTLQTIGVIAGLVLIAGLGVNLVSITDINETQTSSKNSIPKPPPTPMEDYGVNVQESSLKSDERTNWVNTASYVPENFSLDSIQNNDEGNFVTYTYLMNGINERFDTFESNVNNGIVMVYQDSAISYDEFVQNSKEQITYDPLRRYFLTIDNVDLYVEEGEDAYDRPTRVYMHDGKHSIVAISSQALPSDLAQMVRSTMN